ncbi:MAG: helicase-associated domain-containing protein [Candidatus Hydrogenedentota bacterium]
MRHGVSLLVSLEGMSRAAFQIASELANNSRSGLTVRFLAKKLEMPEEEIEYLLDVYPRLMFTDLTKVKLVPEGQSVIRRIHEGLEHRGDVPALFKRARKLEAHEFRRLEEQVGVEQPAAKKAVAEELIARYYTHPDSLVSYVATRGFSQMARELFDILWQSSDGIMPVSQLRVAHGGPEFELEQALYELFRGFAAFELFRFDGEDRLVRVVGLLSELRQWRESNTNTRHKNPMLKAVKNGPERGRDFQLSMSDTLCRLVAAIAAKPARLRGDGDLFREDRRRLSEIVPEEAEPSLSTCLWAAQGLGWLAQVDNELRAGELEALLEVDRVGRQHTLYEWFMTQGDEGVSRRIVGELIDDLKPDSWYGVLDLAHYAMHRLAEDEQPTLKQSGGHWRYMSPTASGQWETRLVRSFEESFYWLGLVELCEEDGETLLRLTRVGHAFIGKENLDALRASYPRRKGEFVVQPNFDIVVPTEEMDPLLTVPLDQFAERVSTGSATVYHVNKNSFTQAIQEGHDGDAFVHFLVRHNRNGELPLNVSHTLEDWRGAMKRVRLRTLHVLESDDPLVVAELMHCKRFNKKLAPLAPGKTLTYKGISKGELTKELEKDGFIVE